ncbi:MAG: rRNA maturation RNase YbeY [Betaproteobacteria bacterium]|nr:rRNA maturation RNase YbeY [Betaproteobacteria bacterium]
MPTSDTSATRKRNESLVTIQYGVPRKGVPSAMRFRAWAKVALVRVATVTLRIVDEEEGRALHRNYRDRDYPTNVLTFVYSTRPPLAGDIALCAPVIAREARAQEIALDAHYAHLTVHGLLHLQGYDHMDDRGAADMEARESRIMKALGFADPYGEANT